MDASAGGLAIVRHIIFKLLFMSLDIEFSQFEPWKINSKLKDIVREDHLVRFRF